MSNSDYFVKKLKKYVDVAIILKDLAFEII